MGQKRGCPPALRLARTYAGHHYHPGCGAPCLRHPHRSAWIPCAPRGPPANPLSCRRRPRHRQSIRRNCR